MTGYEPNDWFGLAGLAILAIAGMVGAAITARAAHKSVTKVGEQVADVQIKVSAVKDQVQNDHPISPNLRDDLDEIRDLIKDMRDRQADQGRDIRGMRQDMGEMRGEAREDRHNLSDLEVRLNAFIRREHPDADPL